MANLIIGLPLSCLIDFFLLFACVFSLNYIFAIDDIVNDNDDAKCPHYHVSNNNNGHINFMYKSHLHLGEFPYCGNCIHFCGSQVCPISNVLIDATSDGTKCVWRGVYQKIGEANKDVI